MFVRREQPGDVPAVRRIVAAAFARPEHPDQSPVEVDLLDRLRADPAWLPALSVVALDPLGGADTGGPGAGGPDAGAPGAGEVVGHVVCTRGRVDGHPALGLGPLAVRPDRQRQGVGSALMHAVLGAAEALGEPLVGLLGDPAYYHRFGFRAALEHRVVPPEPHWGRYFQVRLLTSGPPMTGTFAYAAPFHDL